jgi:hypothetical protein
MRMPAKFLLCFFMACAAVRAQAPTAQINGNVRDDSGLAVETHSTGIGTVVDNLRGSRIDTHANTVARFGPWVDPQG